MGQALQRHVAQDHFSNPVLEAIISVSIASNFINQQVDDACAPIGLTGAQYHVLRILCQNPKAGLSRTDILRRLVEKSVDVTRSINNLVKLGFVERLDDAQDKRVVLHRITQGGLESLSGIDQRLRSMMLKIGDQFSEEELKTLIALLEKVSLSDEQNASAHEHHYRRPSSH